jgi:hypothetical protein
LPVGAAEFRWTPLAEDIGERYVEFKVSNGVYTTATTVRIDVRSAVGGRSAPRFVRPSGDGTSLNLITTPCVEIPIEVVDEDSPSVEIREEPPRIEGATLERLGPFSARWRWCPSSEQLAAADRFLLVLSADDGDNPRVMFPYLVVIRRPPVTDMRHVP